MTKGYARFLTVLFCFFLGGMLVWSLLLPDREKSEVENRTLQQWPAISTTTVLDGSYMSQVERYFADQFPLRDQWTGLKARSEEVIGKTEFNGVYLCARENTLIAKVDPPDETLVEKNLGFVRRLAEKTTASVYLGLIPSAAELWRDKLPAGAESWAQDTLFKQAAQLGLPMVDFQAQLSAHAQEDIFYRTDHHWTTLGAYYGYTAVMDTLGREPIEQSAFTPETVTDAFHGTLYSTSGVHWLPPDRIQFWAPDVGLTVTSWRSGSPETATLYDTSFLTVKDKYSAFLGGNQPLCVIRNDANPDGGKLLLIRDSYSDALAPFLAQSFFEVHLLDLRYYRASAAQYVADNEIDTVIVLYSIPNFITDQNLVFLGQ